MKKLPLLLALSAFGLASCGGTDVSSSIASDTSDSASSITSDSSSDSSSSITSDSSDSSSSSTISSDSSTSIPPASNWTSEEEEIFLENLGGHLAPYCEAFDDYNYEVLTSWLDQGFLTIEIPDAPYELVSEYALTLEANDFIETTDQYYGVGAGMRIYEITYPEDYVSLIYQVYMTDENYSSYLDEGTGIVSIDIYPTIPYHEFPEAELSALIQEYYGIEDTIVIPSYEADYYIIEEPTSDYYYIDVYSYVEQDITASYISALLAAGYQETAIDGTTIYLDSSEQIYIQTAYNSEEGLFIVAIFQAPLFSWPEDVVATSLAALGVEGVTLPAPDYNFSYYSYDDQWLSFFSEFSVYCYGGDYVAGYGEQLIAEGYTLSDDGTVYIDSSNQIAVEVSYDENVDSTDIYVTLVPEAPTTTTTWPEEEIATLLGELGISSAIEIPAPEGDITAYEIDESWMEFGMGFFVNCYVASDITDSYIAQLEDAGWVYNDIALAYVDPTMQAGISCSYYSDSGYLEISIINAAQYLE